MIPTWTHLKSIYIKEQTILHRNTFRKVYLDTKHSHLNQASRTSKNMISNNRWIETFKQQVLSK